MKKFFAIFLAIITLLSIVSVSAFAEDEEPATEPPAQTGGELLGADFSGSFTVTSGARQTIPAVVDVVVEWGPALTPVYTHPVYKYDSKSHSNIVETPGFWSGNLETWVKISNHSNVKVQATIKVEKPQGIPRNFTFYADLFGGWHQNPGTSLLYSGDGIVTRDLEHAVGKPINEPPTETYYFKFVSDTMPYENVDLSFPITIEVEALSTTGVLL